MTLRQLNVDPEKELVGLFEALDVDSSGSITVDELRFGMRARAAGIIAWALYAHHARLV